MLTERYLDLLKSTLLNEHYIELEAQLLFSVLCAAEGQVMQLPEFWAVRQDEDLLAQLRGAKAEGETIILETGAMEGKPFADSRLRNYTEYAYTLVGRKRLDHLHSLVDQILSDGIAGDLIEAGVWRGGCSILMRAILEARDCRDRSVWLCDSFQGLPASEAKADHSYRMSADRFPFLAVSEAEVRANFRQFHLLDGQVKFVPGWFSETLIEAPVQRIALLRIDVDLYSSTTEVLNSLYPKVSTGGWVVIDDYHILPPCKEAVDAYRGEHGITEPLQSIDKQAVCWQVA